MINILPKKNDDISFTKMVTQILNNSISIFNPDEVYVVQIDRRFDYKRMNYSHKLMGALGVWNRKELRVPPFNPKKIVEELYFKKIKDRFVRTEQKPLHIAQFSDDNRFRRLETISENGLFIWYSGETNVNSQGSLMCYAQSGETQNYWFASFVNNHSWQLRGTWNISNNEIMSLSKSNFEVRVF